MQQVLPARQEQTALLAQLALPVQTEQLVPLGQTGQLVLPVQMAQLALPAQTE